MITQLHLTKDMINIHESDFYTGKISPELHEDVAVVYIDQRLRKLFKHKAGVIAISRPRGLRFALRYLYEDDAHGRNAPNAMRRDISIDVLNSVMSVVETKLTDMYRYVASEGKYEELIF